ncbi:MAG: hypothetical protein K6A23_13510 [Butyrivibrio sp.]|nr:hypothetical protein [Butyrivibrio sp.]
MLCECCNREEAITHITGHGYVCLKCNNKLMLKMHGRKDDFQHPDTIFVYEPDGTVRQFALSHRVMEDGVFWTASEINGGYIFEFMSDIDDNTSDVIKKFQYKIISGISFKTIERSDSMGLYDDVLSKKGTDYSLNNRGNVDIRLNEKEQVKLSIDGEEFSLKEFGAMLKRYAGASMCFQIQDRIEPLLKKDDFLVAIKVTAGELLYEFEEAMEIFEAEYVGPERITAFEKTMLDIANKLDILYHSEKMSEARFAGQKMIDMLQELRCEDEDFPKFDIQLINNIINKP